MRASTAISVLVATLCVVNAQHPPVTRVLAQSQSLGSAANDTAALEVLQKYLGNSTKVDNLSPEETKKLLEKLNEDAKSDTSLKAILTSLKLDAQTIAKYTEKTFASIGETLSTFFSGSIKPVQVDGSKDSDEGVFSSVWNSLFGKKKKKEATTNKPSTGGSGSGSGAMEVGAGDSSGSGSSTTIDELQASSSTEDTSIQTTTPTTTQPATTKPAASSSPAKLLTTLPIAGAVAAVVVINFL